MPPRTDQIKAVAHEAQIELWLATVQHELLEGLRTRTDAVTIVMEGRGSDTSDKYELSAGKTGLNLRREAGRSLLGEVAKEPNLSWKAHGASQTWLATEKMQSRSAKGKFFLDSPLS